MQPDHIEVQGRRFDILVVQERRRTAVANFNSNSITVKLPRWVMGRQRSEVVGSLVRRVAKRLERLGTDNFTELDNPAREVSFGNGDLIHIMGRPVNVIVSEKPESRRSRARLDENVLWLTIPFQATPTQREQLLSSLGVSALCKLTLPDVAARMAELNSRHYNFSFNELKIKRQKRLWGSTTHPRKVINLNYRLLFAPYEVMEYVMAHELSHLKEHNHSKAFWALVARAVPDYKARRKWLRQNGSRLGVGIR